MPLDLTPVRGLLFRITHAANLKWLLANRLHCANGAAADPNFVAIGNPDLIGCASDVVKSSIEGQMRAAGLALEAFVRPGWYF